MDDMEVNEASKKYTYEYYLDNDDDVRFELIDGVAYMMASPSPNHQIIAGEIYRQMWTFLKGKSCRVFMAPCSVFLSYAKGKETVVEPDLFVLCDMSKMNDKGCVGGPDMVLEVLSPSTSKKDRTLKLNKYREAGVREFWIIDPNDKTTSVHILKDGEYVVTTYSDTETAPVHVLEGCMVNLQEVFAEMVNY